MTNITIDEVDQPLVSEVVEVSVQIYLWMLLKLIHSYLWNQLVEECI